MAVHVFIPARYGSSRFPGKPLAHLNGEPLIWHTWRRAREARLGEPVVLTDDKRIADTVRDFGGKALMTPTALTNGTERCAWAAEELGLPRSDIVVNLQGDAPATPPQWLAVVAAATPAYGVATAISHVESPPAGAVHVVTQHGRNTALYFSRASIPYGYGARGSLGYKWHHGLYAYPVRVLREYRTAPVGSLERREQLEQLRFLEQDICPIHCIDVGHEESPEVNWPDDVAPAAAALLRFDEESA